MKRGWLFEEESYIIEYTLVYEDNAKPARSSWYTPCPVERELSVDNRLVRSRFISELIYRS